MTNFPNFDSSQVYKALAAGVAAESTGSALIVKRRTTQLDVSPAWPQESIVTVAGCGATRPDDAATTGSVPARLVVPPQAPSSVVAAAAPAPFNSRLRRIREKFVFVLLDMCSSMND
jgi:hypothetical protein